MRLIEAEARDHDVRPDAGYAPEMPPVLVEPVHIEQVVINLISNSIEAMAAGHSPQA